MTSTRSLSWMIMLTAAFAFFYSTPAWAGSGYITGIIQNYNRLGAYCEETSITSCTGAKYLQSSYRKYLPVKDAQVMVVAVINQGANESVYSLGEGNTNAQGRYVISWNINATMQFLFDTNNAMYQLRWRPTHKDGRFSVRSATGAQYFLWGQIPSLTNGTTASAPQNLGTYSWGNASSPNAIANLYVGALRQWDNISISNRMNAFFTDVKIRIFQGCETEIDSASACFIGSSKTIKIPDDDSVWRQFTILHEMGHAVSYLASRNQNFMSCAAAEGAYKYDGEDEHYVGTPEHACIQFEEGFADFIAATALYAPNAVTPIAPCLETSSCTIVINIEKSNGVTDSCDTSKKENRWVLTTARFLWDLYDSTSDYAGDIYQQPLYTFIDTIHSFDNGTGNGQKNEPWNSALTQIDNYDGRSTYDYKLLYEHWHDNITSLNAVYSANCSPAGN